MGHPLLLRTAWALVALLALGLPSRANAQTAETPNFTIEYHHADLSGNIRLTTDEYGAVVREAIHLPFGERDTGECGTLEDGARPLGYQGKPRDPKTCLDDFGARDYRAAIGRFQTVDPVLPVDRALRDPQQWNRYAYARNNPLIYTDPDGRFIVPALILAVGAVLTYDFVVEAPTTTGPSFEGDRGSLTGLFLHTLDRSLPSKPAGIVNAVRGQAGEASKGVVNPKIYAELEKQLAKDGAHTIHKALKNAKAALAKHLDKLPGLKWKSAVETTIKNVRNQIATLEKFIADKGL